MNISSISLRVASTRSIVFVLSPDLSGVRSCATNRPSACNGCRKSWLAMARKRDFAALASSSSRVRSATFRSSSICARRRLSSPFLRTSTSALSNKLGTVILIKNINTGRNETLRSAVVKGPPPVSVPQIVMPASTSATVAVSRGPRRSAAHNIGRIARKPSGSRPGVCSIRGLKAMSPTAAAVARTPTVSKTSLRLKAR